MEISLIEVKSVRNKPQVYLKRVLRQITNKQNSVAFTPEANYTDSATATCRRNSESTFEDGGVSRGQRSGSPPRSLISVV
jgi:hypothetical protein